MFLVENYFIKSKSIDIFINCTHHMMSADKTLARAGLYFDEINKIRILEPDIANQTQQLRDECRGFVDSEFMNYINIYS